MEFTFDLLSGAPYEQILLWCRNGAFTLQVFFLYALKAYFPTLTRMYLFKNPRENAREINIFTRIYDLLLNSGKCQLAFFRTQGDTFISPKSTGITFSIARKFQLKKRKTTFFHYHPLLVYFNPKIVGSSRSSEQIFTETVC